MHYTVYSIAVYMIISATAITCPPLYNLTDGSVSYSNVPGLMATYSCDTGFALVGNKTRTCTGDGSNTTGAFNGAASTCERECMD